MAAKKETAENTDRTMKAVVKVTYNDKEENKLHKPGEKVTVTEARFKEINSKGKFLEKI